MNPSLYDISAALRQYLRGLKEAGIESVPKGRGRFSGELRLVDGNQQSEPSSPNLASTQSVVGEANSDYKLNPAPPKQSSPSADAETMKPESPLKTSSKSFFVDRASETLVDLKAYPNSLGLSQRQAELESLSQQVSGCTKCVELARCRNRVVFGVGNVAPRLAFLGEAPGADEDRQGEPFVGAAGQLLNKIIAACRMSRADVYILNTIKCRPPGNRNPAPDEVENCWTFTQRQLEILRPEFICCLGLIATKQLLKTTQPLGQLRQKFHRYRESKVLVTYHPAYLLRTESAKKLVWEDMKMLMNEMGIEVRG